MIVGYIIGYLININIIFYRAIMQTTPTNAGMSLQSSCQHKNFIEVTEKNISGKMDISDKIRFKTF